jgi:hypothetical protein
MLLERAYFDQPDLDRGNMLVAARVLDRSRGVVLGPRLSIICTGVESAEMRLPAAAVVVQLARHRKPLDWKQAPTA